MVALTALGLTACGGGGGDGPAHEVASPTAVPAHYSLAWSDEFSASTPALSSVWTYDLGAQLLGDTVWGNSEQQYYTRDAQNVRVEDGQLIIQAVAGLPDEAPGNLNLLATSARVKTDTPDFYAALGNSPYGFYEIRAKVPCVEGAWPAIWMMGRDGEWPARGELDIMEWFGRYFAAEPNQVQSGVHTAANFGSTSIYEKLAVANFCSDFHRFQLHWQPTRLTFAVDEQTIMAYDKPANATLETWPFDQPAHLLLNVAVGGNLGIDPNKSVDVSKIPDMRMVVDYVRIYQP